MDKFINMDQKEQNEVGIMLEEESQDLELSGFTTAGSFSTAASWIGGCVSSGSSLSSAGN